MKRLRRSTQVRLSGRRLRSSTPPDDTVIGAEDEFKRSPAEMAAIHPFDDDRELSDKAFYSACYAPHTSLFFNQLGDVRACCHNIQATLGNIRLHSIREIWDGLEATRLREALQARDLSMGCTHCAWQAENGANDIRFSREYDTHPVPALRPRWPRQMEFALTNACNLQCVMCTGWNSSAIRTHREGLPPLEVPYDDAFFDDLAEFLPHLDRVTVLGGEPFLGAESLRLLQMLAELDHPPSVWVTTNGTQWTPRVRRLLDRLPMGIEFSIDGTTKGTFEQVRVGASFDRVSENLVRYRDATRRHGTPMHLSFCLMTINGHEFADLLLLAENAGVDHVKVSLVTYPLDNSYYRLDAGRLRTAIEDLERSGAEAVGQLARFRHIWDEQLAALRHRLSTADQEGGSSRAVPRTVLWEGIGADRTQAALAELREWAGSTEPTVIRGDEGMIITSINGPLAEIDGEVVGRPLPALLTAIERATESQMTPSTSISGDDNEVTFIGSRDGSPVCVLRTFLFQDAADLVAIASLKNEASG